MSERSEKIRREFKASDDIRDEGLKTPETVVRYDDIVYAKDDPCQKLDVYRPKGQDDRVLPVIVSVHGGAWVYGDKERYQYYCMSLAQIGFAVVNYTYRLAPEHRFPAQLEDVCHVMKWIVDNAEEYGLNANSICAVGDSAGAHLLGLYTALEHNKKFAEGFSFEAEKRTSLKAIALNCGCYQLDPENGFPIEDAPSRVEDLLGEDYTKEQLAQLQMVDYVTPDFPPVFLMTCTGDILQPQAAVMAQKLMECSVPFRFHYYGDQKHSLGHVFHCNVRSIDAYVCNCEECEFFMEFIPFE